MTLPPAPASAHTPTPAMLADQIAAYLDDAPANGGHSDAGGANAYELLEWAKDEIRSLSAELATKSARAEELQNALELAYRELKAHDADYHYRTPISVNNMIVDALMSVNVGSFRRPGAALSQTESEL